MEYVSANYEEKTKGDYVQKDNDQLVYQSSSSENTRFVFLNAVNENGFINNIGDLKYGQLIYLALVDKNVYTDNPTLAYHKNGTYYNKELELDSYNNLQSRGDSEQIAKKFRIYPELIFSDGLIDPKYNKGDAIDVAHQFSLSHNDYYNGDVGSNFWGYRTWQEKDNGDVKSVYANHGGEDGQSVSLYQVESYTLVLPPITYTLTFSTKNGYSGTDFFEAGDGTAPALKAGEGSPAPDGGQFVKLNHIGNHVGWNVKIPTIDASRTWYLKVIANGGSNNQNNLYVLINYTGSPYPIKNSQNVLDTTLPSVIYIDVTAKPQNWETFTVKLPDGLLKSTNNEIAINNTWGYTQIAYVELTTVAP